MTLWRFLYKWDWKEMSKIVSDFWLWTVWCTQEDTKLWKGQPKINMYYLLLQLLWRSPMNNEPIDEKLFKFGWYAKN